MDAAPIPPDPLAAVDEHLAALDQVPLHEQPALFEELHATLTRALAQTASAASAAGGKPDPAATDSHRGPASNHEVR